LAWAWTASASSEFGTVRTPAALPPEAIGGVSRGCLAGAQALPAEGPGWQAMRLSRHRNFGHPNLVRAIATLAEAALAEGWSGILVGDLAQPRGGPMTSGHASHQTGLDVDIWFEPAPPWTLSLAERETRGAPSVVAADGRTLNEAHWTASHGRLLEAAARLPDVDRIFVHAAIKEALCSETGADRAWLRKIRPWWGHDDHFHVRLRCPAGDGACVDDAPPPPGDGCDASLAWWFSDEAAEELRKRREAPPRPGLTLADLPAGCRAVFDGS
jgi:penicillin-insensitive murein endopeptidase